LVVHFIQNDPKRAVFVCLYQLLRQSGDLWNVLFSAQAKHEKLQRIFAAKKR